MSFTAKDLKEKLWNTMVAVEERRLDAKSANAVTTAAREIIQVVRTELALAKACGQTPPAGLLESSNG